MTKKDLRVLIGENIRRERLSRGMSIDELAEVLGLTPGFVGLIERGHRGATAHTLYKLSLAFDISLDCLFAPADSVGLSVAEMDDDVFYAHRKKVSSMVVGLSEAEMLFVIDIIKGIRAINHTPIIDDEYED